jgi:hypothetical protein
MTTNISVPNGAASPVTKTFTVARSAAGDESAVLYLREGASPNAYPKLEFSTKSAQAGNVRGRAGVMTFVMPYGYNDVNGNFVKLNQCTATLRELVPDDAPDAVRKDFAAFIAGCASNQQVKDIAILGYAS